MAFQNTKHSSSQNNEINESEPPGQTIAVPSAPPEEPQPQTNALLLSMGYDSEIVKEAAKKFPNHEDLNSAVSYIDQQQHEINKTRVAKDLSTMGFSPTHINNAFKIYKNNYGSDEYNLSVLTEIVMRLQSKENKKRHSLTQCRTKSKPTKSQPQRHSVQLPLPPIPNNNDVGNIFEEKKLQSEDSESYEMPLAMNTMLLVQLQPEGDLLSPQQSVEKGIPSFIPNNWILQIGNENYAMQNDKPLDIDTIVEMLNGSVGLFKSKHKRINAFTEMILLTNKQQRQVIKQQYEIKYKCSLSKTIEKHFKGTMRELLLFLIMSDNEFTVKWIELSIKKKDINLLTLIICTQTNETLQIVCKLFDSKHKKTMKSTIDGITSNIFHKRNINKFLLKVLDGERSNDNENVDTNIVQNDVKHLINASKSKKELNKETYINIFTQRSFQHLYEVAKLFEETIDSKTSLIDTVKSLFKESSEIGHAICVTLYFACRKFELFSNCLAHTIHEPGPHFVMFLRIIVERVEIDLTNIIQIYGVNALKNFIELDIKAKDNDAAHIINKLCGF